MFDGINCKSKDWINRFSAHGYAQVKKKNKMK